MRRPLPHGNAQDLNSSVSRAADISTHKDSFSRNGPFVSVRINDSVGSLFQGSLRTAVQATAPGSLNFGLKVGKDGELEYRGPTSSVIGDRLPTVHDGSEPSRPETLAALDFQPNDMELQCHVNLFVEWQNSSILVLPGSIIDQIVTSYPPPSSDVATRAVLWAILSLTYKVFASHIVDHADRRALSDQAFEEAARLTTNLAHRKPSVEVVQAACILACREYSCGHENSAWTFHGRRCIPYISKLLMVLGIACTVGSSIGLQAGRDYDKWVATGHLTPEKAEARVVAYWATILADR